jgi:hypothetical protein
MLEPHLLWHIPDSDNNNTPNITRLSEHSSNVIGLPRLMYAVTLTIHFLLSCRTGYP